MVSRYRVLIGSELVAEGSRLYNFKQDALSAGVAILADDDPRQMRVFEDRYVDGLCVSSRLVHESRGAVAA